MSCPACGGRKYDIIEAAGRATLYSYVINHRPRPDMGQSPHSIAIVTLAEGPRMMTNIIGCEQTPEALQLDMPLVVTFKQMTPEITLPLFTPR